MSTTQNKETPPSATQTTPPVAPDSAAEFPVLPESLVEFPTTVTGTDYPTPGQGDSGTGAINPGS